MDRRELLLSMFDPAGRGLEIGAGYNPLLRKADGFDVKTLDHGTREQIRDKYRSNPTVDIDRIEEVDFVSDGRPMVEIVGERNCFDFVIASHVIEHTPDMIGFLRDIDALLRPGGRLVLAVPDKRRCFDVLMGLTSTGMVLQASLEKRTRHTPGQVFDYASAGMLRGGQAGWGRDDRGRLGFANDLASGFASYRTAIETGAYIDAHAWRFTPSSFRLILAELHQLGEIALKEAEFHGSDVTEFYVGLSRDGAGCPHSRLDLARMIVEENAEIVVGGTPDAAGELGQTAA